MSKLQKIHVSKDLVYKIPEDVNIDTDKFSSLTEEARNFYILCELLKLEKESDKDD